MYGNVPRVVENVHTPLLGAGLKLARPVALLALLCLLVSPLAFGQAAPSSPPVGQNVRAPLPHLYWHFLMHQNHLDRAAVAREQRGKEGKWLSNYYQQRLGFTDAEFSMVREAALQLDSDLKQIDTEVQAIIQADRARHPRVLLSPNDLPPVPPRLLELRDEREALIQRRVDSLKAALGPKLAQKLDALLQNEFAPNVKVQYLGPPRPHDPSKHPVPPFPKEVQP